MRWDVAVVGAGVVGCAIARALARRGESVLVLEKERSLARHQSGRSSGVLHAGFTYKPGSLKASFSVDGARAAKRYARERGVAVQEVGKVVVARSEAEVAELERLRAQGEANGVRGLRIVDEAGLRDLEPRAQGLAALHSPETAIVDGAGLVKALARDAEEAGAKLRFGERFRRATYDGAWRVHVGRAYYEAERLVTCAGLQSDRVARRCGYGHPYRIVPFRGEFYRLRGPSPVRGLVYPVADPRFPFVGVHVTPRTDGSVLLGPTALLALGREAYAHLLQASPRDLAGMAGYAGFWRMLARPEVRAQARMELGRALRAGRFLRDAQALVPSVRAADLERSHSGIRAQLVGPRGEFVDDLLLGEGHRTVHVLNAVSPGLTCSLPFGEHVAERVLGLS